MDTAEVPDLEQLTEDVQTACDALPCNLNDYWLDKIATDLDAFFVDEENQREEVEPNLPAPLFLILNILEYKEGKAGNFSGEIEVSTEDLFPYFRDYLIEVMIGCFLPPQPLCTVRLFFVEPLPCKPAYRLTFPLFHNSKIFDP